MQKELLDEYTEFILECLEDNYELDEHILNEALSVTKALKQIHDAITNQNYLGIYYNDGKESGFRLIEPLVLGQGFKRGDKVSHEDDYYLRAYVIKDTDEDEYASQKFKDKKVLGLRISKGKKTSVSKSGREPYWRLFKVNKITRIKKFSKKFGKRRPDYNSKDKMMGNIIVSVPEQMLTEITSIFD